MILDCCHAGNNYNIGLHSKSIRCDTECLQLTSRIPVFLPLCRDTRILNIRFLIVQSLFDLKENSCFENFLAMVGFFLPRVARQLLRPAWELIFEDLELILVYPGFKLSCVASSLISLVSGAPETFLEPRELIQVSIILTLKVTWYLWFRVLLKPRALMLKAPWYLVSGIPETSWITASTAYVLDVFGFSEGPGFLGCLLKLAVQVFFKLLLDQ